MFVDYMRKLALESPRNSYQSISTRSVIPSCRNLHFSASSGSNGQTVQHNPCMELFHNPARIGSLKQAKSLHGLFITMGSVTVHNQEPVFLHNNIISKYVAFGEISAARKLFDKMHARNVVSYNTMISCYSYDGSLCEALSLFSEMRKCALMPTQFTYGSLLSCDCLDACDGMQLHALIEKSGILYLDAFAGTALLGMYAKHGFLDEALGMFEFMPKQNLVTRNTMIFMLAGMGCLQDCTFILSEIMMSSEGVSECTFVNVLSSLQETDKHLGEQMHGLILKYGFDGITSICNSLMNMYGKASNTLSVEKIFESAPVKDIVSWNTLIGVMAKTDTPAKALYIFLKMCMSGLSPNETTLANVMKSCSKMQTPFHGECIHAMLIKKRLESDVYTGSALVNFYVKFDKVEEAHACFLGITNKNLVSWNSLLLGYSNRGSSFSVKLLLEMIHSGFYPNELSFSTVIKSSLKTELQQLHSLTIKMGFNENAHVSSSLIISYAQNDLVSDALNFIGSSYGELPIVSSNIIAWIWNKTGQYEKTQELYATIDNPDTISWNILIAACSRNGDHKETFELFYHMRRSQISPDNYTFVSLFSVCTRLCNLALGSCLHGLIMKVDFDQCDTFVCNIMIDMYGKCGSIESSIKIFNAMKDKNIISWTALVSTLGLHGHADEALERFREMEGALIKPDKVAFLAVLSACRHAGFVKQGMNLFNEMNPKYGIEPDIDHYAIMVDLLTRYGHIKEAEKLILEMPFAPNALIWRSFLEGCKKHRTLGVLGELNP